MYFDFFFFFFFFKAFFIGTQKINSKNCFFFFLFLFFCVGRIEFCISLTVARHFKLYNFLKDFTVHLLSVALFCFLTSWIIFLPSSFCAIFYSLCANWIHSECAILFHRLQGLLCNVRYRWIDQNPVIVLNFLFLSVSILRGYCFYAYNVRLNLLRLNLLPYYASTNTV